MTMVMLGDLTNESEAQSDALVAGFDDSGGTVEGLEDTLTLFFGNAGPAVRNSKDRAGRSR